MKTSSFPISSPEIFDHELRSMRQNRCVPENDFLGQHISKLLVERLNPIKRVFPSAAIIGQPFSLVEDLKNKGHATEKLKVNIFDESLPIEDNSMNLILANLHLQWINDLPGYLWRIRNFLKPDGLFIGTLFGGNTLNEFRSSCLKAEMELFGGASARVIPMVDLYSASQLLVRANFALPVADREVIKVTYPSLRKLIDDLRSMALTNSMFQRNKFYPGKGFFESVENHYRNDFSNGEGQLISTFEVIYLTGWSHHKSQQKALKPGSAVLRLTEALS